MTILSDFEDRVSKAVEGMFAGVFRAPVQPAELARACAKEMDRRKKLGVGKIYVPNLYSVLLSPEDGDQLGGFTDTLAGELETYLVGHARERGYELPSRPRVRFLVDDDLKLGRYEVIGELVSESELAEQTEDDAGYLEPHEDVYSPEPGISRSPVGLATLTVRGLDHDIVLAGERLVIGRLKACDICLADANVSREHAVLEREGAGWVLEDLGSTNGTLINGERVRRVRLRHGDVITIGVSELVYNEPGS